MKHCLVRLILSAAVLLFAASAVFAQGSTQTSSLSGVVVDKDGGVIPGATVEVKNTATNEVRHVVTNEAGAFSVPALAAGNYTVMVSLTGFKTVVISDVKVLTATPAAVKATMEIGGVEERVEVTGHSEVVQTTSTALATTIQVDQINRLPTSTRNALNFVTFLPGVDTATIARNSTVNGLPQSSIAITLDGMSVQDNYLKTTDGFFARVTPRQDAVEEITVSSATPGADASGQGAVQIKFVTRSGSNMFKGTAYEYYRSPKFNTNYYFNIQNNLPKNQITLHQYGASEGGPIVLPGMDGHGKAFFFINYEEFYQPTSVTRTRTIMNPLTQSGTFQYTVAGAVRTVDLIALAAANGQTTAMDPTTTALLANIAAAAKTTGTIKQNSDPNTMSYVWQPASVSRQHQPTGRVDYNVNTANRLTGSFTRLVLASRPDLLNGDDPIFPGFSETGNQISYRNTGQLTLRSTLSPHIVNEAQFGGAWGPTYFSNELTPELFGDTNGYALNTPGSLSNSFNRTAPSSRSASSWNVIDTLSWLKGNHNLQMGAALTQANLWLANQTVVPSITFGVDTANDPANAMFNTTNFQGASTANLTDARAIYGFLTGRVTAINSTARLDEATTQYAYGGKSIQRGRINDYGTFIQDTWRLSPTVTLNAGLRWEIQLPFEARNSSYSEASMAAVCGVSGLGSGPQGGPCNMFKPGTQPGDKPVFTQYTKGAPGYKTDWNNYAPNIGIAWRPSVDSGFLRAILGDPEQATIRAAFSVAYNRNGMATFSDVYGSNPGVAVTANRNVTNGNLTSTWPLLFNNGNMGPPPTCPSGTQTASCVPLTPIYPIVSTTANAIYAFDPNWQVSSSRSYSVGLQRALSRDMAVEIRYVGTRNLNGSATENWNEFNLVENNFLNEFRSAQANLQANMAAGRGASIAYAGPNTGTAPLPIYLAYFTGSKDANNSAAYTGTNWSNTTITGRMATYNPQPNLSASTDLNGSATFRSNAINAGLPANFFLMNPDATSSTCGSAAGSACVVTSNAFTRYNSLQLEVRRRLSHGLQVNANYTYGLGRASFHDSQRYPLGEADYCAVDAAHCTIRHAFKFTSIYELPVGRGKRFGTGMNALLDGVIGGWEVDATGRVQTGRTVGLSNVQVVGMSINELQDAYTVQFRNDANGVASVYMLPQDIIDNTIKAYSTSATSSTGYGALGAPTGRYIAPESGPNCYALVSGQCSGYRNVLLTGPKFVRIDFSVRKQFSVGGRRTFAVVYDMLNLFNAINFIPVFPNGTTAAATTPTNGLPTNADNWKVTSAYTDVSNTFDPGGRLGQLTFRFSW